MILNSKFDMPPTFKQSFCSLFIKDYMNMYSLLDDHIVGHVRIFYRVASNVLMPYMNKNI